MSYAAIRDGEKAFTADTLPDLIHGIAVFNSDSTVTVLGYKPRKIHSYTLDWTAEEIRRDRAQTVARWICNGDFPRWRIYSAMT
jgi:hypothetical protein